METITTIRTDVELRVAIAGRGPAVLLLHGLGDGLESWWERGWAQALAQRFRVVAYDARGHGKSGKPSEGYDAERFVADARHVLEAFAPEGASVVGYSLGGRTAMRLAGCDGARLRAVIAGGAHPTTTSLAALAPMFEAGLDGWIGAIERRGIAPREPTLARLRAHNDATVLAAITLGHWPVDERVEPGLAELPCLLWAGREDPIAQEVRALAQRLPRATFHATTGDHLEAATALDVCRAHAFLERAHAG
jgi:pimeloyl-ACP methyl ester carboxylesterase